MLRCPGEARSSVSRSTSSSTSSSAGESVLRQTTAQVSDCCAAAFFATCRSPSIAFLSPFFAPFRVRPIECATGTCCCARRYWAITAFLKFENKSI